MSFADSQNGEEFTYIDGTTGLESLPITYNHGTGWIVPNGVIVFDIVFANNSVYRCSETAGNIVIDVSGNGNHGTINNATLSLFHTTQIINSNQNNEGYSTKAHYVANGWTWEVGGSTLDDDVLMPAALATWEPFYDSEGQQVYVDGEPFYVLKPYTGGRYGI